MARTQNYSAETKARAMRLVREFTDRPVARPGRPASLPLAA